MATYPSIAAALALLVGLSEPAWAGCEDAPGTDRVQDAIDRAETALTELDIAGFKREVRAAEALLPCVREPLSPAVVADFHRFWGIRAFGDRDPLAGAAFAAARHLEPSYRFPETLIPSGNPVLEAYGRVDLSTREVEAVEPPAEGDLLFDGRAGVERPVGWPVVVQHVTSRGVDFTSFLRPGDPLPDYVAASELPDPVAPTAPRAGRRLPLLLGTGAAVALSGVLYGAALHGHARYADVENNPVPDAELPGLRARTNALVVASAFTAAAAAGGGVTLALTW